MLRARTASLQRVRLTGPGVMIEKFAGICRISRSEFLDLNHTSKIMILVSLLIPKFAPGQHRGMANFGIGTLDRPARRGGSVARKGRLKVCALLGKEILDNAAAGIRCRAIEMT